MIPTLQEMDVSLAQISAEDLSGAQRIVGNCFKGDMLNLAIPYDKPIVTYNILRNERDQYEVMLLLLAAKKDMTGKVGFEALEDAIAAIDSAYPDDVEAHNLMHSEIWLTEQQQEERRASGYVPPSPPAEDVEKVKKWEDTFLPFLDYTAELIEARGDKNSLKAGLLKECYKLGVEKTSSADPRHDVYQKKLKALANS